jgi:hypothetical protein
MILSTRTKILITVITVVAIVILVVIINLNIKPQVSKNGPSQSLPIPSVLRASVPYGSNTLLSSNGQALISYNYKTGQITALSPRQSNVGLDNVDSFSCDSTRQYIIFHSPGNADADYWWLYSLKDRVFTHFDTKVMSAKFVGDKIYAFSYSADNNVSDDQIESYDLTLKTTSQITVPAIEQFFVSGKTYILQTNEKQILTTEDGVIIRTIAPYFIASGLYGDQLIGVDNENGNQNLISLNIKTKRSVVLASDVIGSTAVNENFVLYQTGQPNRQPTLYRYNLTTNQNELWEPIGNAALTSASRSITGILNGNTSVVENDSQFFLVGSGLKIIPATETFGATIDVELGE